MWGSHKGSTMFISLAVPYSTFDIARIFQTDDYNFNCWSYISHEAIL